MVQNETLSAVYLRLDNRPGTLEHATRVLREKRINIESMSLETVGSTGFARILTPKFRDALDALSAARLDVHETQLVAIRAENKVGEINRIVSEIAAAGINVESVFTAADGRVAIRTSDNESASRIIGKL